MATNYTYSASAYGQNSAMQTPQQFFPQPQGNVYFINNSLEVANVPMSGGISVAMCMPENLIYLKSLSNGTPYFQAYTLTPYEPKPTTQSNPQDLAELIKTIKQLDERVKKIETSANKKETKGGMIHEF